MRKGKIYTALIIASILFFVIILEIKLNSRFEKKPSRALICIDWENLTSIHVNTTKGNLHFLKTEGVWYIVSDKRYRADENKMQGLINSLSVLEKNKEIDDPNPDYKKYNLDKPPVVLKLISGTEELLFKFGVKTAVGEEVYVMIPGDEKIYLTNAYILFRFFWSFDQYRDKRVLNYDPEKIVRINISYGAMGDRPDVELIKSGNRWGVITPELNNSIPADMEYVN
ncbi:MAG: DUF4340 domain-containing protein, partial [bacterium]|nr:DUF4340 domain-containing protein [bacterium]